jgi:exodeoxyribonuclease III
MCGDFNVTVDDRDVCNPQKFAGTICCSDQERQALDDIISKGWTDSLRFLGTDQSSKQFSYWDYRAGGFHLDIGFRLDHIYLSSNTAKLCSASWIDKKPRSWRKTSDHCPVVCEIQVL